MQKLTTGQIAKLLGMPQTYQKTIFGWMTRGVQIAGRRVFLGSTRLGRYRYSTQQQVREFVQACNAGATPTSPETAAEQARRDEAGVRRLAERLG